MSHLPQCAAFDETFTHVGAWDTIPRYNADLVFAAAQETMMPELYDWNLDKRRYIDLLREYDKHRDSSALAEFIGVRALGE